VHRLDLLKEDGARSLEQVPVTTLAGKTVLVTGASGIVGTHFLYGLMHCQQQLGLPVRVYGVVQQGVPDHLKSLVDEGYVSIIVGNMAGNGFVSDLPRADFIVHAATYGQPGRFIEEAQSTLKLNTVATFGLLEKLLAGGQFLFVSSSEVYSGLTNPPFSEDQIGTTNTTHARSCYIEAKRCGEAICNAYRVRGISAKSARLSLGYGPGTRPRDKRVMYSLIEKGLMEKTIRLLDRGEARRTYCYISDAVHMMWRILLEGTEPVYNVGGTSHTTIAELASLIGDLLNVPVEIPAESKAAMAGAPDDMFADIGKFIREFGPVPLVSLKEGLERTVEWQKAMYS